MKAKFTVEKAVLKCLFIGLLSLGLLSCKTEQDATQVADEFFGSFAASCQAGTGQWTDAALGHTRALVATLETLREKQDENCHGISNALAAVQNVHDQLGRIALDPATHDFKVAQEQRMALLLSLSNAGPNGDPDLISMLKRELYLVELDIAQTKSLKLVYDDQDDKARWANGLSQLTDYVSALVKQGNLAACMETAPYVPFQIGSSLLAIGGNFATSTLGSGLSAIGQMMSSTVDYLRTLPIEKAKLDFQNVQMQEALSCSLETMSDLYCDADTSLRFIEFALDNYNKKGQANSIWNGLDLLGHKMPSLNQWLAKVANGIVPGDTHAADRLNTVWKKHSNLRIINNSVMGAISNTLALLTGVTNPQERLLRERAGFKAVMLKLYFSTSTSGFSSSGPINDAISIQLAVCELSGDPSCEGIIKAEPNISHKSLIDRVKMVNGFSALKSRTIALISMVNQLITRELQDTINQDPDNLVTEALQPRIDNESPVDVMERASKFSKKYAQYLRSQGVTRRNIRAIKLAEETANLLDGAIKKILDINVSAVDVVEYLFQNFRLLDGIQFLNRRISNLVQWEIEERIQNHEIPKDLEQDLIAAGHNITRQLEDSGIYIRENRQKILRDIRHSQSIAQQNLKNSIDFLAPTINKALKAIKQMAKDAGETKPTDPSLSHLADLCLLVLTTSTKWPEEIDLNLCKGTILDSSPEKSGLKLEFDQLYKKFYGNSTMPLGKRLCTYSNFLKASNVFRSRKSQPLQSESPLNWAKFQKWVYQIIGL